MVAAAGADALVGCVLLCRFTRRPKEVQQTQAAPRQHSRTMPLAIEMARMTGSVRIALPSAVRLLGSDVGSPGEGVDGAGDGGGDGGGGDGGAGGGAGGDGGREGGGGDGKAHPETIAWNLMVL